MVRIPRRPPEAAQARIGRLQRQLFQSRDPAFWLYVVALFTAASLSVHPVMPLSGPDGSFVLLAMLAWALWTTVLAALICSIDRLRTVPTMVRVGALAWGTVVVWRLGGLVDSSLSCDLPAGLRQWTSTLVAPPVEEGFKLLGAALIALIVPSVMSRVMGGVVCGLLIGLGTAFAENWGYATRMIADAPGAIEKVRVIVQWLVERGVVEAPWSHSTFSTITALGVTCCLAWTARGPVLRCAVAAGTYFLAVVLHASHNAAVTSGASPSGLVAIDTISLAVLTVVIWWARWTSSGAVACNASSKVQVSAPT